MIPTLPEHLAERDLRERRRSRHVLRARLRAPVDAAFAWWATFGEALVPFALGAVAALPVCALALRLAMGAA